MSLDLSSLNSAQKVAVENLEGPCLIIAGAGSGKTRVLTYKIASLIDSGVSPYEILALTFTNKAAKEMKQRVGALVDGAAADKIWIGTFHSMFARILRMEADKIGFTRDYTIYDSDDSLRVLRGIMSDNDVSPDRIKPKSIQSAISHLKNRFILPQDYAKESKSFFEKTVSDIYSAYAERLCKCNSMDFDDLLINPLILFDRNPGVLEKYRNRFKFLLVDEYQDTNRAQYEIIKLLAAKFRNISVVGDDAQSIYKWRGAEIQNIFDFETDYPEHKIFRLEQNYRSTKKIIDFAGIVIKKNSIQIKKVLWTDNAHGEKIIIMETLTDKEESSKIARYISGEIHKRKINFKDIAVLYRTNAQSRALEESLRHNGIPYIIIGGTRFYERKEIKDVISHLRVIVNSADDESMTRVLLLKEKVGRTTLEKLQRYASEKNIPLFETLINLDEVKIATGKTRNILSAVSNLIYKFRYLKDEMHLPELIRAIIDEVGLVRELKLENTAESDERINNINELISAVAQFADIAEEPTIESFLQQVSLVTDIDQLDDKKNAVTLMTIHASKGLEFPVVFIAGLEDGLFPVTGALNSMEEMEEERRLFYVAITRAMDMLYISFANQRYRFGTRMFQVKSRFLKEIEDDIRRKKLVSFDNFKHADKHSEKKLYSGEKASSLQGIHYEYFDEEKNSGKSRKPDSGGNFADIVKGKSVYHGRFGKGVVISVSGRGMEKKAEILFADFGLKKIMLKYAKMSVDI